MALRVLGLAATATHVYALRADGAVFVLFKRGDLYGPRLEPAKEPFWAAVPAVPGTEVAAEQEG